VCPADPLAVEGEHDAGILVLVPGRRHGGKLAVVVVFAAEISRTWSFQLVAQRPVLFGWILQERLAMVEGSSDPELVGFGGQHVRASDRQSRL
jgi:hypothetical protein